MHGRLHHAENNGEVDQAAASTVTGRRREKTGLPHLPPKSEAHDTSAGRCALGVVSTAPGRRALVQNAALRAADITRATLARHFSGTAHTSKMPVRICGAGGRVA